MVPGEKRSPDDRAIAGVTSGPGAVQAGAVDMMRFGPVGLGPRGAGARGRPRRRGGALRRDGRRRARPHGAALRRAAVRAPHRARARTAGRRPPGPARLVRPGRDRDARVPHRRAPQHRRRRPLRAPRPGVAELPAARRGRALALSGLLLRAGAGRRRIRPPRAPGSRHERRDRGRRRRRHRLRRRHPGVQPGRRRRLGGHARARAGGGDRGVRPRPAGGHVHPLRRPDQRRRGAGRRRQLRGRVERRLLRRLAARAVLRVRPPWFRRRRPALAGGPDPLGARPLVRPGRGDPARRAADLGRRPVRRGRVGGGVPQRRAHLQPRAGRRRPADVHQLQLDAVGLPVRREAIDAAQLPAGRPRARGGDPPAARGPADRPRHDSGLPVPGRLHRRRPGRLPAHRRAPARSRRRS